MRRDRIRRATTAQLRRRSAATNRRIRGTGVRNRRRVEHARVPGMHLASYEGTDSVVLNEVTQMKKMHTGLMSAAALLLSAAALAAPQGTSGSSGGSMGGSSSSSASQSGAMGSGSGSSSMRGSAAGSEQLSSADRKFIMEAASAGMFEVQAAQLAQTKAQDSSAKSYARQMIQDHEKNNQQLMQIAQSKGVTPPTKLDAKHQAMLTKLQKADGDDFDRQYGKIMDQSHRDTVQLFERGQKQVKDTELKSYISQTLPTLHQHHEQAASLPGGKGGSTRQAEAGGSGSAGGASTSGMGGSGSSSGGMGGSSSSSGGSSGGMGGASSSAGAMGGSSSGGTSGSSGSSSSGGMGGTSGGTSGMGGSSAGGSSSGSMGGTTGGASGMGGTTGSSSSSSSPGTGTSSGTSTRPPGTTSSNSDTGSTGRP